MQKSFLPTIAESTVTLGSHPAATTWPRVLSLQRWYREQPSPQARNLPRRHRVVMKRLFIQEEVDSTKAVALDLKPGAEWRDVNFSLKELRTFAIRGASVNKGSVQAAANARVGVTVGLLYRDSMVTQTADGSGPITEDAKDIFEITDVPLGVTGSS